MMELTRQRGWEPRHAEWVWLPGADRPENAFVQFRRSFTLPKAPAEAQLFVSADCKYLLFVNGSVVGRGPITTDPTYKQVDIYEVAQYLRPGENVIAALVLHRQAKTSRLWPVRGGFLAEFISPELSFGADAGWRARWAEEYLSDTPFMTHQYGHQEWLDARLSAPYWQQVGFDASAWHSARVIPHGEQSWPEALEIRTVPHMLRDIRHPQRLVGYFSAGSNGLAPHEYHEPAEQICLAYVGHSILVWNEQGMCDPGDGPMVFQENMMDGLGFVVDLGEEMLGYPFIEFECPAGVVVDIGHGEVLSRNRVQTVLLPGGQYPQRYADRYISRGGRQRWEIFDSKGCRYLEIHFRNLPADAAGKRQVTVHAVGLVRSVSPVELKTAFSCSDECLNRVFAICRRTMEVKNQDWHICDAQREQNQWIEPFQEMMHLQMFGRHELHRKTLQAFSRAQLPDGFLPSTVPAIQGLEGGCENQYMFTTFTYPLVVYLDWLFGGEDERHKEMLATCERIFHALDGYIGADGVPANTPGSHWCEWSGIDTRPSDTSLPVKQSWDVAYFAIHLVLSLESAARLAQALGRDDLAQTWRKQAQRIREHANERYWSESRHAYIDGVYDGQASEIVSQTTNAIAVITRLGDESRLRSALTTVLNPQICDVPSQINQMAFFHEALESMDMDEAVLDRIRTKWKKMLDLGASTTWEGEFALERANGCCFGFSAHPLWYLVHNILGVVPLESGYRRFSVRITPRELDHAQGRVATPHGYIEVTWQKTDHGLLLNLVVPTGTEATVAYPRGDSWRDEPDVKVNGQAVDMQPCDIALCTYVRTSQPACALPPGRHTIEFVSSGAIEN